MSFPASKFDGINFCPKIRVPAPSLVYILVIGVTFRIIILIICCVIKISFAIIGDFILVNCKFSDIFSRSMQV